MIARTLAVFFKLFLMRQKRAMVYRAGYATLVVVRIFTYMGEYAAIMILVNKFQSIAGWTLPEMLFLHSINVMSYTIAGSFFWFVTTNIEQYIATGELDGVLVKPISPLVWLSGSNYAPFYLWASGTAFVILLIATTYLGIAWTVLNAVKLLFIWVCAILLQMSLFLIGCAVCFWSIRGRSISMTLISLRRFASYPISVYGPGLRLLLTFIVPIGFINYYPAGLLMARPEFGEVSGLVAISPLVGPVLFALALLLWRRGLNSYCSAGS